MSLGLAPGASDPRTVDSVGCLRPPNPILAASHGMLDSATGALPEPFPAATLPPPPASMPSSMAQQGMAGLSPVNPCGQISNDQMAAAKLVANLQRELGASMGLHPADLAATGAAINSLRAQMDASNAAKAAAAAKAASAGQHACACSAAGAPMPTQLPIAVPARVDSPSLDANTAAQVANLHPLFL